MNKVITVSYLNRNGARRDIPSTPKIVLANHILKKICSFSIGDKVTVHYSPDLVIIKKLT